MPEMPIDFLATTPEVATAPEVSPNLDSHPAPLVSPTVEEINFQLKEQLKKLRLPRCLYCRRRPNVVFKPGTEATAELGPGTVEVIPCCSARVVKEIGNARPKGKGRRKPHCSAFLIRVSKLAQELWDTATKPMAPVKPDAGEGAEHDAMMAVYSKAIEEFNKELFKRSEATTQKAQARIMRPRIEKRKRAVAQQKLSRKRNRP